MGDTGVLVATQLARRCDVVGVATRPALVSGQELGARVADPAGWRRNFLIPFDDLARLDAVRTVHGSIERIDPDRRIVHVARAAGGRVLLPYDVLVVATGVRNGFWRHDRVEDLADVERGIDEVAQRLAAARTVAVIGGGATGVSVAANLAMRGVVPDVHLFHSGDQPLPDYPEPTRRRIVAELDAAGVHRHPGHRAIVPDGFRGERLTSDPVRWATGQAPFAADVVLWAVGRVEPNSSFLPPAWLDEDGFVRVDAHLRVPGTDGVFAVGDVAASDPNRSSARNWGFLVVAANVRALASGKRRLRRFSAPSQRWGSILGAQSDGLLVFQPDGKAMRVPRPLVQPLLFDLYLHALLYRGVRHRR